MATLSETDLKTFARKITQFYWPDVAVVDEYITPEYMLFCMKVAQASISASAKIKFIETVWKASFPGNIRSLMDVAKMLTTAVSDSIAAYNRGQISNLAKAGIVYKVGSLVKGYFAQGPDVFPCPEIRI